MAVPVYYSTGKRHKAFLWGLLSGQRQKYCSVGHSVRKKGLKAK